MANHPLIHYIYLDTVSSTNTWVKESASSLDPNQITCVYAGEQTAGRGRWKRKWLSVQGNNLYATLYFCLPHHFPSVGNLGQILSLACVHVLEEKGFQPRIKWPNDILIAGKKIAGILCETWSYVDRLGVALGIGLNVDVPQDLLDTLDQPATSLAALSGRPWQRESLLFPMMERFAVYLEQLKLEGFAPFLAQYTAFIAFKEKQIFHTAGGELVEGAYDSINERGELILRTLEGRLLCISSGEINGGEKRRSLE